MSLCQTESLCRKKETINKPKGSILNGERYLQSDTSDKGFIAKVDKEFKQFSITHTHKKQATWLRNGQGTWIDVSQRRNADGQQTHKNRHMLCWSMVSSTVLYLIQTKHIHQHDRVCSFKVSKETALVQRQRDSSSLVSGKGTLSHREC